jgi:putative ABC transport system permease protein
MIKNYLIVAFRNFWRNKVHSLINLFGLTLGLTCCLFITLYVTDEKSYDRWIPDYEQLYRVSINIKTSDGKDIFFAPTSATLAKALLNYPQVEETVRIYPDNSGKAVVSVGPEKQFHEKQVFTVDSNIFRVFSYHLLAGNSATPLREPNTVVISNEMAEKYFGREKNAQSYLNRTLKINEDNYNVTGILADIPGNSYFRPDFLISFSTFNNMPWMGRFLNNWHTTIVHTFIKLKPGTDLTAFEKGISHIADQYVLNEIKANAQAYRYFVQPLADIHLHSDLRNEISKNSSAIYIRVLSFIALFILLIACINFINLATARATMRAREVGVRKVIGAQRGQLIWQFMAEACLMSLLSLVFSALIIWLTLPLFNSVAGKTIALNEVFGFNRICFAIGLSFLLGLIAGIYPAIILSSFSPVKIIQGHKIKHSSSRLRSSLVVTQFAISILLIISTIVVYRQLQFMKSASLGFDKSQVMVIPVQGNGSPARFETLISNFNNQSKILAATASSTIPGYEFGNNLFWLKNDRAKKTDMRLLSADDQFLKTYNIKLVAGKSFKAIVDTNRFITDVLINEATLPYFGWKTPEEAIGQEFDGWGTISSIYKDFHFTSLQTKIAPLAIFYQPLWFGYVSVKVNAGDLSNTIAQLENTWKKTMPSQPFDYFFIDEEFDKQYHAEEKLQQLFMMFSVFAIVIACLGLFGLATFTAELRIKEISIRKVLGASVKEIFRLLSKDFLKLVVVASIIAFPLAWWGMHKWLEYFAYRINMSWWVFAVAGLIAVIIALGTISFQAIKAAIANPVKSLRTE